jgi:thioredoxin 1
MEGHNNLEITAKELQEKINNGDKIIVDFHGLWCGPCKMMMPVFERVAQNNGTDVQMYTMDIDKNREFVSSLGIRSIPTIKIFDGGEVKETKVGVLAEQSIKELVSNLLLN